MIKEKTKFSDDNRLPLTLQILEELNIEKSASIIKTIKVDKYQSDFCTVKPLYKPISKIINWNNVK